VIWESHILCDDCVTQDVVIVVCGLKPDQPTQEIDYLEKSSQSSLIVNDDVDKKIGDLYET